MIAERVRVRAELRPIEPLAVRALLAARAQRIAVPGEALAARERLSRRDGEPQETLSRHPDAALIRSPPGMGTTLTAEPIAGVGGIHRLAGPDQLAAAAGLGPILTQSGKVRYPTRARGGDEALLISLARRRADVLHAVPRTREPYRADFRQAP